jgi:hypothetical protein
MRLKPSCPGVTRRGRILVSVLETDVLMPRGYEEGEDTGLDTGVRA